MVLSEVPCQSENICMSNVNRIMAAGWCQSENICISNVNRIMAVGWCQSENIYMGRESEINGSQQGLACGLQERSALEAEYFWTIRVLH